ncbi:hypothetical protein QAD02_004805 [Eretmocerus hayati]|uniref:Uncharacterized protein n=1 Tax=Eretmocerus hayati TaxID=131215 RepID=A0ACC2NRP9_9HYME|nr:hypothetical protein QAD02_004805 [Eretmocerus hayati]
MLDVPVCKENSECVSKSVHDGGAESVYKRVSTDAMQVLGGSLPYDQDGRQLATKWRLDTGSKPERESYVLVHQGRDSCKEVEERTLRAESMDLFLLAGHGSFNLLLYSCNRSGTPAYFCGRDPNEDFAHVLCQCPLYLDLRDLDAMGTLEGGDGSWDFSQVLMGKSQYLALFSFAKQTFRFSRRELNKREEENE